MSDSEETQKITKALYEHNLELAVKNKTLSLLEKLYKTGIQKLAPADLAEEACDAIRRDLNLEIAEILIFKPEMDSLVSLSFSKSERLEEIFKKRNFSLKNIKIADISKREFFHKTVYDHIGNMTNDLEEVWGGFVKTEDLSIVESESHITTVLLQPLLTGNTVLGVLLLGLNRDYIVLNQFEKQSINSCINVIAVGLGKAYLYKELQDANEKLRNLIKQRESLVHLVTHKVKGSFTRSKYIFAEILEGTFGATSPILQEMAGRGLESDNDGIETVDLVLNAANLQTGTVKYEMKSIDFKEIVSFFCNELKDRAEAKGLKFESYIKDGEYNILGDSFWLKEVVHNLIDNSVRYTKKGSIKVSLEKKDSKILFYVKDTGVGITDEDKKNLFTEGGRGKNSVLVNVDSTGYGLYTVKLIVDAHKGRIWAESEGENKGSTFFVELNG